MNIIEINVVTVIEGEDEIYHEIRDQDGEVLNYGDNLEVIIEEAKHLADCHEVDVVRVHPKPEVFQPYQPWQRISTKTGLPV